MMIDVDELLQVWDTLSDAAVSHRFSSYSKRGKVWDMIK